MSNERRTTNQEGCEEIRFGPTPPIAQSDGLSRWMEWNATASRMPSPKQLAELAEALRRPGIVVSYAAMAEPCGSVKLVVKQAPAGEYTELYDACLKALFELEKIVGGLETIQGAPRSEWERQFMFARRFGAIE